MGILDDWKFGVIIYVDIKSLYALSSCVSSYEVYECVHRRLIRSISSAYIIRSIVLRNIVVRSSNM